jgi:FtsH-binding integral membrane protein
MFSRFSRSFELVKFSAGVLRKDKELLIFPLLSSIAAVLVLLSFIPLFATGSDVTVESSGLYSDTVSVDAAAGGPEDSAELLVYGLLYLIEYFVIFFFNTALVGAALIRMEGGNPTVGDGLRIALSKIDKILGYALIAATVGMILRAISQRVGFVGQIVVSLIGAGWTIATYLTVPILVSRDIGPMDAVKESAALLKATWGENVIANSGLGLFFFLIYLLVGGFCVLLITVIGAPESGEWVLGGIAAVAVIFGVLALIHAALQGIFSAALYRYAMSGTDGASDGDGGEVPAALANAFASK